MNVPRSVSRLSRERLSALTAASKGHHRLDRMVRYNPRARRRVETTIAEFAAADRGIRARLTETMTLRVLDHARQTAYGRGRKRNLDAWPILEKDVVREGPARFVTRGLVRIPASTSGTSGSPLRLSRSLECIAAEQAFLDHVLSSHGLSFRTARVAVLRGDVIKDPGDRDPPYWKESPNRLVFSNPHLSPDTVRHYVDALERFRPQILWAYPSMIGGLLRCLKSTGLRTAVPVVLLSSEVVPPLLALQIEEELSATVLDYYGQAERVCLAFAVERGVYRFAPAYGRVELIPEHANADAPRTARVVATGFWNAAMPLVRYDTGDSVVLPARAADDLSPVELGLEPFPAIIGRTTEYLVTRDGRTIGGLNHLPRDVEGLVQAQVVQESLDVVVVRVLSNGDFDESARQQLLDNARQKIPPEVTIEVTVVDELERSESGKVPFLISRL